MNEIKKYMKGRHELLCIPMVLIHKLAPPPPSQNAVHLMVGNLYTCTHPTLK